MKKTLLLSALVVTATAFAGTTGKFTIDSKHTVDIQSKKGMSDFEKKLISNLEMNSIKSEIKGAGEVKLGESGVTLGGDVKVVRGKTILDIADELKEDTTIEPLVKAAEAEKDPAEKLKKVKAVFEAIEAKKKADKLEPEGVYVKELNAFVKYDFTTNVEGLDAYIKGNVKAKNVLAFKKDVEVMGEGQVSYKKDDMTYTLNSKTKTDLVELYFTSDHEAKAEGKYDKVEDILVSAKLHHGYTKNKKVDEVPFNEPMYLLTEAKGAVNVMDGLKIGAHNKFDMLFNGKDVDGNPFVKKAAPDQVLGAIEIDKFIIMDEDFSFVNKGDLAEMFKLYATYDKNDVEVTGAGIVEYFKINKKENDGKNVIRALDYGVKLDAKYKGIKNVELGADALFAGMTQFATAAGKAELKAAAADDAKIIAAMKNGGVNLTLGLVRLGVNGKYDAKVNDKLTVTPKAEVRFDIIGIRAANEKLKESYKPALDLSVAPEVAVEYKATDSVTLTASTKAVISASKDKDTLTETKKTTDKKFGYEKTALEAKLGLKYTW